VRSFNQVLHVDPSGWVDAEGMTTYEDLARECLAHGVMPTVVPQLKTITLGGAVAGVGIESSSHRHGLVHDGVLEIEVLLGDGRVVVATPGNEHADLFYGFPNSYGTLGYALRVKARGTSRRSRRGIRARRGGSARRSAWDRGRGSCPSCGRSAPPRRRA